MKTRFTYLGGVTIETILEADFQEIVVLPSQEIAGTTPDALEDECETVAASLVSDAPEPSISKKRRTLMGFIRGAWFIIFTAAGEATQYIIDNLTGFNLPPRTGAVVGAALYGLKRGIWPDTTL